MRLAQLSDIHYTSLTLNPLRLFPKRFVGHLNWLLFRKKAASFSQMDLLPDLFQKLKVDLVLLGGDFTSSSMKEEFTKAERFVKTLPMPWLAIPGNHDCYTKKSKKEGRFFKTLANRSPIFGSLLQEGVEAHKISPDWWVVSLDTSLPNHIASSQGLFSEKHENSLENLLSKIPNKEKVILFNHYPFFLQKEKMRNLVRSEALENLLKRHREIRLYLHGHTHRRSIADLQMSNLPIVSDSGSCSQIDGGSFHLIDLKEEGCSIDAYRFQNGWTKTEAKEFAWKR